MTRKRSSEMGHAPLMKYVALLSGGKDSCFNLHHCAKNGHILVAAASLGPAVGKGIVYFLAIGSGLRYQVCYR